MTTRKQNLLEDNLEENLAFIQTLSAARVPSKPSRNYFRTTDTNNQFVGVKTSREFFFLFKGYTVESADDIHDILDIALNDELHYFLSYKTDNSNIDMDNYVHLPVYEDLVTDLASYFNI